MDLKEYFQDVRKEAARLEAAYPDGVVPVMSIRNRDKNSVDGAVYTATPMNAARGIVNNTHRVATDDEYKAFLLYQEEQRIRHLRLEQNRGKQYILVGDPSVVQAATAAAVQPPAALAQASKSASTSTAKA